MTVATDPRKTGIAVGPTLLASSAVAIPHTGTTNETALVTLSLPALSPNAGIVVRTRWALPNSGNTKIARHRLGGIGGSVLGTVSYTTNTFGQLETTTVNRNSAASQYNISHGTRATDVVTTTAVSSPTTVNTAVSQDLVISSQLQSAAETHTLESYEVWLLP
jgi:hypothetical protein